MSLSCSNVAEATDLIVKSWRMLLKECQECGNREQREKLHPILDSLERVRVNLIKLEVEEFGFEFWKAIEREESEAKRKRLANKHCEQLGLEIPYPEISD